MRKATHKQRTYLRDLALQIDELNGETWSFYDVAADPDATAAELSEQIDYAKATLKELTDARGDGY